MRHILSFLIFLVSLTISGQDCEYEEYFKLVSQAKKDCIKKDYKSASKKFKQAFSQTDFPLGHDLSFALITARETKDVQWAKTISIQLAKGGVPINYFKDFREYNWYNDIKSQFKVYRKFYSDNFNLELRDKWVSLILLDRKINGRFHEFREAKIKLTLEEMIQDASSVSKEFQVIIDEYGFPGEKEMGYLHIKGKNRIENFPSELLVRHIYQRGETFFENEITSFVCQGKLRTENFMLQSTIGGYYGLGLEKVMKLLHDRYKKE